MRIDNVQQKGVHDCLRAALQRDPCVIAVLLQCACQQWLCVIAVLLSWCGMLHAHGDNIMFPPPL